MSTPFEKQVEQQLKPLNPRFASSPLTPFPLLVLEPHALYVQVVALNQYEQAGVPPQFFAGVADAFDSGKLVTLWEDQWHRCGKAVVQRLMAMCGHTQRVHGRNTIVSRINKAEAQPFFEQNHLMGYTLAHFKLGLHHGGQLLAAALFSKGKNYHYLGQPARSYELIRFANLQHMHVAGGFTKLLNAFRQLQLPDDVMTYVDRDWSNGNSFVSLGFELQTLQPPQEFWINPSTMERFSPQRLEGMDYLPAGWLRVYNTGNLKLRLRY